MENFSKSVFWDMLYYGSGLLTFVLDHIRRDMQVLQGALPRAQIRTEGRKGGVKLGRQASTLRRHFRIYAGEMKHQCKVCYLDNDGTDTTTEEHNKFPQHIKDLVTCFTHSGEIAVRLCLWCVIKIRSFIIYFCLY